MLTSLLLHSRTQAHVFHFRTKNYAQHKAFEAYYTAIVPLLDTYTEAYQGKYGIIAGYKSYPILENPSDAIGYFQHLIIKIQKIQKTINSDTLQNIIETINELLFKTLYMLYLS